MILDTTFLIDVIRGHPAANRLLLELEQGSEPLRIPTVVAFELWAGAARSRRPAEEERTVALALSAHPSLHLTEEHTRQAGAVSASLQDRGDPIGDADVLLAGTALAEGEALVTRNKRHFERVPGLRLRTY